jgi:hypothetical protein
MWEVRSAALPVFRPLAALAADCRKKLSLQARQTLQVAGGVKNITAALKSAFQVGQLESQAEQH